jgi:EmrB/QacA subfamily drug resistance transporter
VHLVVTRPVGESTTPYPKRWWGLGVLCLSLLIIVMANSSLIVAAPDMTRDLGLGSSDLQWVIDAYTVPYAALMLLFGAIGDRYSRRGALLTGLVVFAAGAVTGSLAGSTALVIAARAVMGTGAAIIMPATLSLLVAMFPRGERGRAITAWTATSGLAMAFGPLLAGALLETYSWSSTFLINVPIAVLAIVGALALVPPSKAVERPGADPLGGLLSILFLGTLVFTIIETPHSGWTATTGTAAVLAVAGLGGFIAWELRHPSPILDLRRLRDRGLTGSALAIILFFLAAFGAIYFIAQQLQFVFGYTALETGVRLLPLAGAVFVGAAVTLVLTPRLGMKVTVVSGMVLGTVAVFLMAALDADATYTGFIAPLVLLGAAVGLSMSPCTDTIMAAFPEQQLGVGGGVNDTALEFGGSLGIAILGAILSTGYADRMPVAGLPAPAAAAAQDSIGGAFAVATQIPGPAAQALVAAADRAFTEAMAHASLVAGIILGLGTVVVALVLPRRRRP